MSVSPIAYQSNQPITIATFRNQLRSETYGLSGSLHITPSVATALLLMNYVRQRAISKAGTQKMVRQMLNKTFNVNLSTLTFTYNANDDVITLIDGQHRLDAMIKSGVTYNFPCRVIYVKTAHEVDELYATMDTGTTRGTNVGTKALGLTKEDLPYSKAIKEILSTRDGVDKPSSREIIAELANYSKEVDLIKSLHSLVYSASGSEITKSIKASLFRVPFLSAIMVAYKQDSATYASILSEVVANDVAVLESTCGNNAAKMLLRKLLQKQYKDFGSHPDQQRQMVYLLQKAKETKSFSKSKFTTDWNTRRDVFEDISTAQF